ncbi:MAG: SGNH/GDSL hydrolase family protein [Propionibacteriaceae bacterium]
MTVTRTLTRLLGIAAAITLSITGMATASAASTTYVALGDSYSSGLGTGSYLNDGTACSRSSYAYPALDAVRLGLTLTLRACAGATVADVRQTQLDALNGSTGYVSVTAGGNDIGFAAVLTECAKPAWFSDCNGAIDAAVAVIRTQLPASLAGLYGDIRAKAPNARTVVLGYPRLFNGADCHLLTWFSGAEMTRLNATADLLDSATAAAASAAGLAFVDPRATFTGHAVCSSSPWINNLTWPVEASFHPNKAGHSGYAAVLAPALSSTARTTVTSAALQAQAVTLTAAGKANAAKDAGIHQQRFEAPDLSSPQARAAAAAVGVDLNDKASIARADRTAEAKQVALRQATGRPVVAAG